MKMFFRVIAAAIILFLGGNQAGNISKLQPVANAAHFCRLTDEDPIIMHGHVKNGSGGGITAAHVDLLVPGTTTAAYSATTNDLGDYEIDSITAGSYRLKIAADHYVTKYADITVSATFTRTDTLVAQ